MTDQSPSFYVPTSADAGRQVAQLRNALELVERIAGADAAPDQAQALDESARISAAYDRAPPVTQRRFDALVSETALWAAAGVEALLAAHHGADGPPRAAAARLGDELERAIGRLARVVDG